MSAANFQNFSSIKIGVQPINTFGGMKIYSASLSVNPGNPTKLTIRCVEGQIGESITQARVSFPFAAAAVSPNVSTNTFPIWIGPLKIPEMYLLSKESSTSSGQRVMTLTFIDKSILLDKIYVGLIGQHSSYNDQPLSARLSFGPGLVYNDIIDLYAVNNMSRPSTWTSAPTGPTDPIAPAGVTIGTMALKIPVLLSCEPCYAAVNTSHLGAPIQMRMKAYSLLKLIDYGRIVDVNHYTGGKIILGVDQWTSQNTDLPETDYNFTELLTAIAEAGLLPLDLTPGKRIWQRLGWFDKNPQYRVKHTGTLRDVLDNFAAEFGFVYFWDFGFVSSSRVALRAMDLTPGSPAMASIALSMNAIKNIVYDPPDSVGFDNIEESESMEGTKNVWFQGFYRKPAKPKSYQRRVQYRQIYKVIDPGDLFKGVRGGRTTNEFATSCALAKFSKNARTLYNFFYATPPAIGQNMEALGLTALGEISAADMKTIIDDDFSVTEFNKIFERYNLNDAAKGLICSYSKQQEQKWEQWETQVAGMYGKYYIAQDSNDYKNYCGLTEKWEKDISIQPNGTKIIKGQILNLPFLNLIDSHPRARTISDRVTNNFWGFAPGQQEFTLIQRSSPWGTDQTQFDSAFVHSGVDYLENLVPKYITLGGAIKTRFFERIKDVLPGADSTKIINNVNHRANDSEVVLVVVASSDFIDKHFHVDWDVQDATATHINADDPPHVYDPGVPVMFNHAAEIANAGWSWCWWNNPNEYTEPDDRDKIPLCDETFYERDMIKEACECPNISGFLPTGDWGQKVPMRTELQDEQLQPLLAPRDEPNPLSQWAFTFPWTNWGHRSLSDTVVAAHTHAQVNAQFNPDQTEVLKDHLYAPFIKDMAQEENEKRYGLNNWYLADKQKSWNSRHQIHHCRGFRINTHLPGTSGNPIYFGHVPGSPGHLNMGKVYHPTGSGFIGPAASVDVIFPSENWFLGVKNESVSYTKTAPGIKQVRGGIGTAGHAMAIDINSVDMTQDFDTISDPAGDSVINAMVPDDPTIPPTSASYNLRQLSLDEYWARLAAYSVNTTISLPQKTLSFRQFGTNPTMISYASPAAGLTNMTVTLDQDGSYIDFSFSNRPALLPSVSAMKNRMGPMLNMNMIR
jgi:hypothetical protein